MGDLFRVSLERFKKEMAKPDMFEEWVTEGVAEGNLSIVQSLSMQGKTLAEIGGHFNITERQICRLQNKHKSIKSAIKNGRANVVALCQSKLIENVKKGDVTSIIYALKIYGGAFFNDKSILKAEITGSEGRAVEVSISPTIYLPEKEHLNES